MIREKLTLILAIAAATLFAGSRAALATFTISNDSQNTATGEYQYTVSITSGLNAATVNMGQGFVVYDFPDLVTSGPDDWTLTGGPAGFSSNLSLVQQNSGNDITGLSTWSGDNPNISNLSFVYNSGTAFSVPPTFSTDSWTLTLYTTLTGPGVTLNTQGWAAGIDTNSPQGATNNFGGNVTTPVPEPTTVGLLGLVGSALLASRRARKNIA